MGLKRRFGEAGYRAFATRKIAIENTGAGWIEAGFVLGRCEPLNDLLA
jgi:hypothetical protein